MQPVRLSRLTNSSFIQVHSHTELKSPQFMRFAHSPQCKSCLKGLSSLSIKTQASELIKDPTVIEGLFYESLKFYQTLAPAEG